MKIHYKNLCDSLPALQKRVAELERMLGQKQTEIEFKNKMIDLAEQTYGVNIKKKP